MGLGSFGGICGGRMGGRGNNWAVWNWSVRGGGVKCAGLNGRCE